ncbi:hypothetical protein QFZ50_000729 [Arthrobacter agilis]|jgi:hypothetical protein|nr:hypothetical protein [Arthrobacter agilis]
MEPGYLQCGERPHQANAGGRGLRLRSGPFLQPLTEHSE